MAELRMPGDDDPEVLRLGQVFRDELRAEAQAYEALAAKDLLRSRSLADVAVELLHRGDRVACDLGTTTFTGVVGDAVGDLLRLTTGLGDMDIDLAALTGLHVVERVREGGRARTGGARSFTARLHEHEAEGIDVELGGPTLPGVRGRIEAVAVDHVVMTRVGGARSYYARRAIGWVRALG